MPFIWLFFEFDYVGCVLMLMHRPQLKQNPPVEELTGLYFLCSSQVQCVRRVVVASGQRRSGVFLNHAAVHVG